MAFKLLDKLGVAIVRSFTRELRAGRMVLQAGIDTYRQVHLLPPLYAESPEVPLAGAPAEYLHTGDFLTIWLIEELAREFNVRLDHTTNIEQLAIERGWTDAQGKFMLLPATAATELDAATIEELLSAKAPR